ncbi:selenium-binding protein SBP56-related protein [Candidatus Methylocalor cossyra]|uniref:Methanethiol oxidase n=1 Tax=Candidatus Methylocalor cossyra TaxID=3108543 RepID=A0ABM9NIF9_9GAMM
MKRTPRRRSASLALLLACFFSIVEAETCLSPYIKPLQTPETLLYLWALPATPGAGEDFLAVIDVELASPTYGKVLKRVGVGSVGNEAHHMGYTDDRRKIWAASLTSNRLFIFDVGSDPRNPKLIRVIDEVAKLTGLSGPHTPYAIPGRILVSMASGPDGDGAGGIAEFTNSGDFIASYKTPDNPYETVIKPEFNRMITSSWVPQRTFLKPADQWDPKTFSTTLQVWDLKSRKIIQELRGDPIALAARWALKPGARYGYNISSGGNSIWRFRLREDGTFDYRKAADVGRGCRPADLRQSPDDKYLYVSCFAGREIQAWDITDPEHIRLHDTIQGVVQPNMMHVTYDGRRLYFTNSSISSIDYSPRYSLQLIQIGPDGRLKLDPSFHIDFSKPPDGPSRPHDMLLN